VRWTGLVPAGREVQFLPLPPRGVVVRVEYGDRERNLVSVMRSARTGVAKWRFDSSSPHHGAQARSSRGVTLRGEGRKIRDGG